MPDPRFLQHFTPANPQALSGPVPSDMGFLAWSEPPIATIGAAGAPAGAGQLALRRVAMPGAIAGFTTLFYQVTTVAVGLTANQCFAGIWDGTGALIAFTPDLSGAFGSLGTAAVPLNAPVSGGGGIDTPYAYIGYWTNGGTAPKLGSTVGLDPPSVVGTTALPATLCRAVTANTGLTTAATVPQQLAPLVKSNNANGAFWVGVS
jgi:hypothetical protein